MTELEKKHLSKKFDKLESKMETPYALYLEGYKSGLFDALEEINKLPIHGVINWVAVDEQKPPTIDLLYLTYNGDEMIFRYWNSTYFEGEHIANEPKVTHWAIVKSPCL